MGQNQGLVGKMAHRYTLKRPEIMISIIVVDHTNAVETFDKRVSEHQRALEEERKLHAEELESAQRALQQAREALDKEKQSFQAELQVGPDIEH